MRVAVCECGVGNVRSVVRAIEHVLSGRAHQVELTADAEIVRRADRVVVPGQGSFGAFARAMNGPLAEAVVDRIRAGAPYLGICLGLQILFEESDEAEGVRGLGVLRGRVRRLDPGVDPRTGRRRALPHIGWNEVTPATASAGAVLGSRVEHYYFAHSFVAEPSDPSVVAATTEYGRPFVSAVAAGAIVGVQFHPEKSQRAGIALLERFFTAEPGAAGGRA